MESRNKLRCVRFVTRNDVVGLVPFSEHTFAKLSTFCTGRRYHHVGLQVRLYPSTFLGKTVRFRPLDITYSRERGPIPDLKRRFRECLICWQLSVLDYFRHHKLQDMHSHIQLAYESRMLALKKHVNGGENVRLKSLEDYFSETTGDDYVTDWRPPLCWYEFVFLLVSWVTFLAAVVAFAHYYYGGIA